MDKKIISIFLFVAFIIFPLCSEAAKNAQLNEVQMCLACHSDKGLTKKLESKERMSLYIDGREFANSVHKKIGCTGCHTDISLDDHPRVKIIKSKKDYSDQMYRRCRICHTDKELSKNPIHSSLAEKASCAECHGSHYIKGIQFEKAGVPENQYCLACHRNKLSKSMKNGELLSVYIDESVLVRSVHAKLKCTECHVGFSKSQHPVRSFNSKRDYAIFASNGCRKCHAEADKLYEMSVHLSSLKSGNLKAPACTDCHGAHEVASTKKDRTIGMTSCNRCHSDMRNSYENSIHGMELSKGNAEAPVCSSCHNAHNIESTTMTTKLKDGCLKCHKNAKKLHSKWLWNPPIRLTTFTEAHFDSASCASCHSAQDAKRVVYLSLYNRRTGKPLTESELLKIFETDSKGLMKKFDINGDGNIDSKEFWDIYSVLFKKGYITLFDGKMNVSSSAEAHLIGEKKGAIKDCEKCHKPNADIFSSVFIAVKKDDGKPLLLKAKNYMINSIVSILPMSKFYVLGLTSIELFDILFIVALIGGIAVPIGHISLRILFTPIRSLRRMGKGGKK